MVLRKMSNIKIIALCGKSGSGKTTLQNYLIKTSDNIVPIIMYTTRPPRKGEVDGQDYHFISEQEFFDRKLSFVGHFGSWYYGIDCNELSTNKYNIGIFGPRIIEEIVAADNIDTIPIIIYASDRERLIRILKDRGDKDCHEVCRRFLSDEEVFNKINFKAWNYSNLYSDIDKIGEHIKQRLRDKND